VGFVAIAEGFSPAGLRDPKISAQIITIGKRSVIVVAIQGGMLVP